MHLGFAFDSAEQLRLGFPPMLLLKLRVCILILSNIFAHSHILIRR